MSCLFSYLKEKDSTLVDSIDGFNKAVSESRPSVVFTLANSVWDDVEFVFENGGTSEQSIFLNTETAREVIFSSQSNFSFFGEPLEVSKLVFKNNYTHNV